MTTRQTDHDGRGHDDGEAAALRTQAEARIIAQPPSTAAAPSTAEQALHLVHELQVHQVELKLQNEELRQTRGQLQDSLHDYADLFDFAPLGYCVLSAAGTILSANLAAATLLGLPRAELTGRPFDAFVEPRSRADFTDFLERTLIEDARQTGRVAVRPSGGAADDERRQLRLEGRGLVTDGTRRCLVALVDITEPLRQQEALAQAREAAARHASEERLGALVEQGLVGVAEGDLQGRLTRVNERFCQLLGRSRERLLGRPVQDFMVPEDRPASLVRIERLLAGRPVEPFEERYQRPDGTLAHGLVSVAPLHDADGQCIRLVGLVTDITARTAAELALRRYRQIVEASTEKLFFIDSDLRYQVVNPAYAAMLQSTPDALQGRALAEVLPPALWTQIRPSLEEVLVTGQSGRFQIELTHPDGHTRWLEADQQPFWEGGQVQGVVVSLHDLTAMRAVQAELAAERTHLEQRVAERTIELQQARDAAEQAARVKSEFLAHMSHELRTPMNTMLGLLQVLERGALAPDQRAMVHKISHASRSLLGILNDILDLSKIEAGQFPLETRPFGLAALLARIASLLGAAAHDKGLALIIAPVPELAGRLLGDPLRLEQVLVNLIGNAIKFTETGEVRVEVALLECTTDQARLRFSVCDTGIGIAPAILTGIFAPFTQADTGITRRFGGTGLGLAICKRLVEAMGGQIGATSQPGVGSTFWCELPFTRTAEAPPGDPAPHPSTEPSGPRLAGLHLLVVDDSPTNREVLTQLLALEGARTTSAGHGQEAIDQLRTQSTGVDAVLMDVQMPVMDGLTATGLIRTELGLTELPVIACTAGVLPTEQAAARAAGATDLLLKPVELEALVAVLRRWTHPRAVAETGPVPVTYGPTATEAFPALPGIDRARAAQCLGQNLGLFRTLLEQFGEEFAAVAAETRAALAAGDPATAARWLHTLKGNAGTLGALALMAAAAELEEAIERGEAGLGPRLEALDAQVTALIAAGTAWCAATRPTPVAAAEAPPLEQSQLAALRAELTVHNLRALQDFETLQPVLQAALGEEWTTRLARAIGRLRFTEALTLLDQAVPSTTAERE